MIASIEKMNANMAKLDEQTRKLAEQSANGSRSASAGFERMAANIAASTLALLSLNKALQVANQERERQIELEEKSKNLQGQTAGAQESFRRNLGLVPEGQKNQIEASLKAISRESGIAMADIYRAAVPAVSARGERSYDEMIDAIRVASGVARADAGELAATAGGLLDISSVTGTGNAQQNLGTMLSISDKARIESLEKISQNLVPAAIAVKERGGTAAEAFGLTSTLTAGMKDRSGERSGQAAVDFANSLAKFLPEEDRFKFDSKNRRVLEAAGTGMTSTMERRAAVMADPALKEQFLAKFPFEEKSQAFIEQILNPGSNLSKLLEKNIGGIAEGDAAKQLAQRFTKDLQSTPLQQAAQAERVVGNQFDNQLLEDIRNGVAGSARTAVRRMLYEDPSSNRGIMAPLNMLEFDAATMLGGNDPRELAIQKLQERRQDLLVDKSGFPKNATESDKMRADSLQAVIDELKGIRANQKASGLNTHVEPP